MRTGLLILFLLSSISICNAQNEVVKKKPDSICFERLKQAQTSFENGLFLDCINTVEQILATYDLKKLDKVHALELAAKASVEIGEIGKADSYVNVMLRIYPHYDLKEGENSESYNRLVKKYKIHPLISIGARNTADWINYKTTKVYSILDGIDYSQKYKKYKYGLLQGFGFMYYGTAEIEFDRHFSLNGDLTFWWIRYLRDITQAPGLNLNFWETDNYMEIPIYVKRYFPIGNNVLPYVTVGIGWNYMTRASGNVHISYTKDDVVTGKNIDFEAEINEMDMLKIRTRSTFEWIAGAGIGYKIKNLGLFLDARYYGGLNSFTDPKEGLKNSTLVNDYFYVDNSVHLTQFEVGVTISYTLFNSIKKSKR